MATTTQDTSDSNSQNFQYLGDNLDLDSDTDGESVASLETDDGQDHKPERILAQQDLKLNYKKGDTTSTCAWYLVQWEDCPILRSSWESGDLFTEYPWLLDNWIIEKQKQAEGKTKELDIKAFERAVLDLEIAERKRRILRRFKRKLTRILAIVDS